MGISKDIIIGSTGVIASEVVYITISKDKVGGEFNEKVTLTLGNKEINQIKIQIGDDNNYLIPNDLLNFKYEVIETEKESLTKNLVKVGLAAASAGSATSAIGSKDSFSKGATSALLGGAALKMGTTTKNKYVLLNLQFKDQKLLSLKMKSEEWDKFDEDHSVITFPEYEKEVQNQKDEINKQIEKIRASFMSLEASEQTEVTKDIQALSSQIPLLDETLEYRRKLVPKRITKEMTYDEESHLKQILTIKRIRKEKLTNEEEACLKRINAARKKPKKKKTAALLCLFPLTGIMGFHRFYVGKIGTGFLMMVTAGGGTVFWLIDCVKILKNSFKDKEGKDLARKTK